MFGITACGSSSDEKEEKVKKEYKMNEVAKIDGVEYTVTSVERTQGTNEYFLPDEGMEYVIVRVKIENKSDEKEAYNSLDWKMVNSNGQEDGAEFFHGMELTDELSSGDLVEDGVIEGTIVFQEPVGDTGLKLNLYADVLSDKATTSFIIE